MMDIATWLGKQLDEDERAARAVNCVAPLWFVEGEDIHDDMGIKVASPVAWDGIAAHIARHDPARVLREAAAKRRVLARHHLERGGSAAWCAGCGESDGGYPRSMGEDSCPELRDMASVYADHDGYNPAWSTDHSA